MDEDIKKRVEAAIRDGAPKEEAIRRGQVLQAQRESSKKVSQVQSNQTTQVSSSQEKQSLTDKIGRSALDIASELVKPLSKGARLIGEGIVSGADLITNAGKILKGEQLPQYKPRFLSDEEYAKFSGSGEDATKEIAKTAAGVASFAVPYGKGANILTKAVTPGAAQAALFESSREGATPESVAGAGVTGAVVAPVLSRLLGLGKTTQSAGGALRRGVVNPQVPDSPFAVESEKQIVDTLQGMGLKGSAEAQRQQIPGVFRKLSSDIQQVLAENPKSIKVSKLVKELKSSLEDSINFDEGIPLMKKAADKFENQLVSQANQGKGGLAVRAEQLLSYKQNLGKQLSRAFGKLEKGMPLTDKEEVGMIIWGKMDDLITGLVPEVKELTKMQSVLYQASPGLRKSAEGGVQLPFLGKSQSLTRGVQSLTDTAGRGLQTVGKTLDTITTPLTSEIGQRMQVPAALSALDRREQAPELPQEQTFDTSGGLPEELKINLPEAPTDQMKISFGQMQQVLLSPDISSKTKDRFKQLYDLQKDTAAERKTASGVKDAMTIYNQMAQLALSADSGASGWVKALAGKIPGIEGGSEEDLNRVNLGFAKAIAKAFAGESGVATDEDVKRWLGLLPQVGDTREERIRALMRLKQTIESQMETSGLTQ